MENETKDTKKSKLKNLRKNKLAVIVISVVVLILIFIGGFAVNIYKYKADDRITMKVASVIPYPAFFVNGDPVTYSKYQNFRNIFLNFTRSSMKEQDIDPKGKKGKEILAGIDEEVKKTIVRNTVIKEEINNRNIEVSKVERNKRFDEFVKRMGGEQELKNTLDSQYGTTLSFYRENLFPPSYLNSKLQESIKNDESVNEDNKAEAEEAYRKIQEGGNFSDLAEKYSDDTQTASKGGNLGYIEKGKMVPELEDKAFSLKEGEISNPVKTVYGYYIIKVTDIDKSGEKERRKVSHILVSAKQYDQWLSERVEKAEVKSWI